MEGPTTLHHHAAIAEDPESEEDEATAPVLPSPTPPHMIGVLAEMQAATFHNTYDALEPLSDVSSSPVPMPKSQLKTRGRAGRENAPPTTRKSVRAKTRKA